MRLAQVGDARRRRPARRAPSCRAVATTVPTPPARSRASSASRSMPPVASSGHLLVRRAEHLAHALVRVVRVLAGEDHLAPGAARARPTAPRGSRSCPTTSGAPGAPRSRTSSAIQPTASRSSSRRRRARRRARGCSGSAASSPRTPPTRPGAAASASGPRSRAREYGYVGPAARRAPSSAASPSGPTRPPRRPGNRAAQAPPGGGAAGRRARATSGPACAARYPPITRRYHRTTANLLNASRKPRLRCADAVLRLPPDAVAVHVEGVGRERRLELGHRLERALRPGQGTRALRALPRRARRVRARRLRRHLRQRAPPDRLRATSRRRT